MGFYNNKNILVAGANGITGHSAVKRLLDEGAFVRAAIHNSNTYDIQHQNLEVKRYDFMNIDECASAVKDMDIVIDSVAYVPGRKEYSLAPLKFIRHNLYLFMNLVEAACNAKIDRMSYIGSSAVYPEVSYAVKEFEADVLVPCDSYHGMGSLKKYTEQVCMHYQKITNTKFGMIRIGAVYGPHDTFNVDKNHVVSDLIMRADKREDPFVVWGDGNKQLRNFIYVDDLVDGLLLTLEKYAVADPINIVAKCNTSIAKLVETIVRCSEYLPKIIYDITKPIPVLIKCLDNTKAKEKLNWVDKTSLYDGIFKTIKWYKENKND